MQTQILVLFAQRKEQYPGQQAPEVLAAITADDHEDNPAYMAKEVEDAKADSDIESSVVITIAVDTAKVMQLLRPKPAMLPGVIVGA